MPCGFIQLTMFMLRDASRSDVPCAYSIRFVQTSGRVPKPTALFLFHSLCSSFGTRPEANYLVLIPFAMFKLWDASRSQQPWRRPRLQQAVGVVAEEFNLEESNDNQHLDPALCTPCMGSRMHDSNDQRSLVEAVKQVNTGEHEEDGPLALVLHPSRSVGSSHFEENPPVPLLPEQSVEGAVPIPPCETLDINEDNPVLEDQIPDLSVLATDHEDVRISSVQQEVQAGINASVDNEPNTDNRPKKKVKRKKI
ncbi:hypothetical protein R1sor_000230 [Riccia sorocarpa]|uniref:Uncharacterized protein n=1 Tax=Riccia sorocarpa TaxID=122646 RepID=A0ABD3GTC3_9MARC